MSLRRLIAQFGGVNIDQIKPFAGFKIHLVDLIFEVGTDDVFADRGGFFFQNIELIVQLEHTGQSLVGGKLELEAFAFSGGNCADAAAVTAGGFNDLHC